VLLFIILLAIPDWISTDSTQKCWKRLLQNAPWWKRQRYSSHQHCTSATWW